MGNLPEPQQRARSEFPIITLLPNVLTIAAICAGLTAIRLGVEGNYELAVQLVLAAAVLDGLDGRLARALKSDSKMGAELDSLADFLNFGVAPPLLIYYWALESTRSAGWISVLIFAVCCVVRLARFNVHSKSETDEFDSRFFVGVPAPAGALLVLLPMFISFSIAEKPILPAAMICLHMVFVGWLLISRIPTWSFKTLTVSRENVKFFLVGIAFTGAAALTYAWVTLVLLCIAYVVVVVWALLSGKRPDTSQQDRHSSNRPT